VKKITNCLKINVFAKRDFLETKIHRIVKVSYFKIIIYFISFLFFSFI
jgi:hypothetical protein